MNNAQTLKIPVTAKLVTDEEITAANEHRMKVISRVRKDGFRPTKGWLWERKSPKLKVPQ